MSQDNGVTDTHHLDPAVFSQGLHALTRLETFERDEIVRCPTAPNATRRRGLGRAGHVARDGYRKISQYHIELPGRRHATAPGT